MNAYTFSDIHVDLEESFEVTVTEDMMDKFLSISGDINPLHMDENYAKEKGFKDRVVYGLLSSSFYSTLAGVYLPGKFCILQGADIQFSSPVFIGDTLTISGKVTYINEAYKQLEIKAVIRNQDNKRVSKSTLKTGVMDE